MTATKNPGACEAPGMMKQATNTTPVATVTTTTPDIHFMQTGAEPIQPVAVIYTQTARRWVTHRSNPLTPHTATPDSCSADGAFTALTGGAAPASA